MTVKVLLAGNDVSTLLDLTQGYEVRMPVSRKGATAKFTVRDFGPGFNTALVPVLSTVHLYDEDGTTLLFTGVVSKPEILTPAAGVNGWLCNCVDATYYLEAPALLVNKKYVNQTADAIVKDIFATYLPGITTAHVQAGPAIPSIVFAHKSIGEALRKLVKAAQQAYPIAWWIDPASDLHWYAINAVPAAPTFSGNTMFLSDRNADLAGSESSVIGVSTTGAVAYDRASFRYTLDGTQIVNNVTVRGGFSLSPTFTDTFSGNAAGQSSFPLSYPPSQQSGAPLPVITVGGVAQTVAYDNGATPTTQWVISFSGLGAATQTGVASGTAKIGTASAPGAGVAVTVAYQFDVPVIARMQNADSVTEYNVTGSLTGGAHSADIYDQTIATYQQAVAVAQSKLKASAFHLPTVQVTITEQFLGSGLTTGMAMRVVNGQVGLDATFVILQMNVTYDANAKRRIALTMQSAS